MNVRLAELWVAIAARLTTSDTTTILNGGRVYFDTEDYADPPGPEGGQWGRQVLIPSTTLWPVAEVSDLYRPVNFVVRSEMNDYRGSGYNPAIPLEKLQDIAYAQLHHWAIPDTMTKARASFWTYRYRPPQAMPEWDDGRSLWWLSSEYRLEAARR